MGSARNAVVLGRLPSFNPFMLITTGDERVCIRLSVQGGVVLCLFVSVCIEMTAFCLLAIPLPWTLLYFMTRAGMKGREGNKWAQLQAYLGFLLSSLGLLFLREGTEDGHGRQAGIGMVFGFS